ncbi:hypothetical protein CCMA1212_008267 [Trichoderma ghanense]|uniref:Uncharacterized protein n=1 Tax=Trichoderma ghanense TaxID=65468 RepID=A0ABY2GX40_9HYPO
MRRKEDEVEMESPKEERSRWVGNRDDQEAVSRRGPAVLVQVSTTAMGRAMAARAGKPVYRDAGGTITHTLAPGPEATQLADARDEA